MAWQGARAGGLDRGMTVEAISLTCEAFGDGGLTDWRGSACPRKGPHRREVGSG